MCIFANCNLNGYMLQVADNNMLRRRRYFLHLAYNGAKYCGWQIQPNAPSVQETLEKGISTVLRERVEVVGCGRTDAGVHASDFYAHFDAVGAVDVEQLRFKLNSFLPTDIVIYGVFGVRDEAHARFDAVSRTYQYHVCNGRQPFRGGLYGRIFFDPDVEAMNRAAEALLEYEDFTSFSKLHTQTKTNNCRLLEAHWDVVDGEYVFTIRSNRFLRNMVRSITGTLLDVGRGKLDVAGLRGIVEQRNRCAAGVSMPAEGLFLTRVEYPEGW